MKANGDYEVSDVPRLLERGATPNLLGARAALSDACEALIEAADREGRALTADERRAFDLHALQIRGINADLAERKRERMAGLVALGIDPSEAR
jgi:hypothetical protein